MRLQLQEQETLFKKTNNMNINLTTLSWPAQLECWAAVCVYLGLPLSPMLSGKEKH